MDGDSTSNSTELLNLLFPKLEIGNSGDSKLELLDSEKAENYTKGFTNNDFPENRDFIPADEDLKKKIIERVEKLFSDNKLYKDSFLLQNILKDKNGYVSVKLISSSAKIKSLTNDWRVVAHSLMSSQKLQLSNDMTKVIRLSSIHSFLSDKSECELSEFRKVMIFDLPSGVRTHERAKQLMKRFGKVRNAMLMSFGSSACPHRWTFVCKCMCSSVYAIVEFESSEEAKRVVKLISNANQSFTVAPIVEKFNRVAKPNSCKKRGQNMSVWSKLLNVGSSDPCQDMPLRSDGPRKQALLADSKKNQSSFKIAHQEDKISSDLRKITLQEPVATSPWMQKRQFFAKPEKKKVVIIREPRGPDGTIGFHVGRAKANLGTRMA